MNDEPWPHQIEGCDFALARNASLLAHDTGTGKCRTAILIMDAMRARRILIVCPDIAKYVWRDQIIKWSRGRHNIGILKDSRTVPNLWGAMIVTYDQLSTKPKLVRALRVAGWDLLICDEAHALKTHDSKRTIAVYGTGCKGHGIASSAGHVVLLTATPMLAHPGEIWPHLRALAPDLMPVPGLESWQDRYCESKTVWRGGQQFPQMTAAKLGAPAKELAQVLSKFMHRVKKRDVQAELPPLLWTVVPVHIADIAAPPSLLREWMQAEAALMQDVGVKTGDALLEAANASPHAATVRRLTGIIKLQAGVEAIKAELVDNPSEKILIFAYHQKIIEGLEAGLGPHGVRAVYGPTPKEDRQRIIEAFRTDARVRGVVMQIQIAEAVDMTAASLVWFVESDWTPAVMHQAVSRAHRYGQTMPVDARVLTLFGSIDDKVARVLERKLKSIEAVIDAPA